AVVCVLFTATAVNAQEIELSNAKSWEVSGKVQLQHEADTKAKTNDDKTMQGFRIRRARLQVKAKLTKQINTELQIDVRDNNPELKDAIGELELAGDTYLRFGQFKVPLWREELRSSSKLMLIERSDAAEFLVDNYLSSRHIGAEFGGEIGDVVEFAVNYSNGSGQGEREDAGANKSNDVNNGKLIVGRINLDFNKNIEVGVSAARNELGRKIGQNDNTGPVSVVAPDFKLSADIREKMEVTFEGNLAIGSLDKNYLNTDKSVSFRLYDFTGIWTQKFAHDIDALAGLDKVGFAAGIYNVEPNTDLNKDEETGIRFGPVFYFGKNSFLQVNGELTKYTKDDKESDFKVRSQFTFNF
ncbi:hypothetical protein KC799_25860, partial [candidate division KSB1 bacterium]|nr:hypothetical protein [candidate division KSB1 bacterium]